MGNLKEWERVVFVRDFPVEDTVLPEGTKGLILAAGGDIYEVATKYGNFLVGEEFLDTPEDADAYGFEFDIHLQKLPRGGSMAPAPPPEPQEYEYQDRLDVWKYEEDVAGGYDPGYFGRTPSSEYEPEGPEGKRELRDRSQWEKS